MIERHLMKLRARDEISTEEEQAIRDAVSETKEIRAGQIFIRRGEELKHSTLILDGLICRFKDMKNGERQVTELHVPGDFADLHSFTLKRLDHDMMALTQCRVALVPHERLQSIIQTFPHLAKMFWFLTNIDAAIHREWVMSMGRRTAIARLAHLFCELHLRLGIVGLADGEGYQLDLIQQEIAECLGLTPVHINRTLKELREQEVLTFRSGRVQIHNLRELRRIAEFSEDYLYLERRPE